MASPSYQIHLSRFETIEDATSLLRKKSPEFAAQGGAEVSISAMNYPDFITRHLIVLTGPLDLEGKGWSIGMASAEEFSAKRAIRPDSRETFAIERLHRAVVDEFGNVTLADADETKLYDVRLVPTAMAENLTKDERYALRCALRHMGNGFFIDFRVLPNFAPLLPPLKQLPDYDQKRELYRSAFLKTGLRRPKHGKHSA
jgi:hypothetical protein